MIDTTAEHCFDDGVHKLALEIALFKSSWP